MSPVCATWDFLVSSALSRCIGGPVSCLSNIACERLRPKQAAGGLVLSAQGLWGKRNDLIQPESPTWTPKKKKTSSIMHASMTGILKNTNAVLKVMWQVFWKKPLLCFGSVPYAQTSWGIRWRWISKYRVSDFFEVKTGFFFWLLAARDGFLGI